MRILSFLIAVLLAFGAVIWPGWILGHPIWGPWTTGSAAVPTPPAEPDTPVPTPKSTETPTATPMATTTPTGTPTATPTETASQPAPPQPASADYPLAGQRYSSPQGDEYSAVWDASGWLHQDRLPPEGHRKGHVLSITIEEGIYTFNGVSCRLHLDVTRNGQGANNPQTVGYGNGLAFTVDTADNGQAWGLVVCNQTEVTGFSIQWLGPLP
jgi:hypothetical protein